MLRLICLALLGVVLPVAHAGADEPETITTEAASGGWFENPTRGRGFFGHTALPLHSGEGFVGQQGFALTTAGVGLSERVSLNVATVQPLIVLTGGLDEIPFSFLAGIKVTNSLTERLHVALGVQGGVVLGDIPGVGSIHAVSPYGILTYGTSDAHVSLTLQPVFIGMSYRSQRSLLLPMLSGFTRMGAHWGLMAEATASIPLDREAPFALAVGGARLFGRHWSVDLGVLAAREMEEGESLTVLPTASFLLHWR